MDFFELKAFLCVSKNKHFTKAANEVHLSPSALSRLISRLESETGTELFNRNSKECFLTDSGKKFAQFALKCIEEKEILLSEFSNSKEIVSGTLQVYASVTACYSIMPPFIKKLSSKYPDIHISIETGDPAGAIPAIKEGRAELAVAAIPDEKSSFFDCFSVCTTPLVFVASSSGPYTNVQGSPQDIVSEVPLILPKTGLARKRFDSWTKSRNVHPDIVAEAEGNEAVMALAALGLGIGLVPQIVLENGPYKKEKFVFHNAGNVLGSYDIGFIQKAKNNGSETSKKIRFAVNEILHS